MTEQRQHVDLHRKLALRRRLLAHALPGPAYVPFVGDGDIAAALYADRKCWAADTDTARVEVARSRLTGTVTVADCNAWPFPECDAEFAVADFDAHANPYLALAAFWAHARKAQRLVLFGTDAERYSIGFKGVTKSLPECREVKAEPGVWREQFNFWWPRYVLPWIEATVAPYRVVSVEKYLRGNTMLSWGVVVEHAEIAAGAGAGDPQEPDHETAVEAALYEAARAGNTTAIKLWLDRREAEMGDAPAEPGVSMPQVAATSEKTSGDLPTIPTHVLNTFRHVSREQRAFLVAFVAKPTILSAANSAGIARGTHYNWLRDDEDYAEAFKHAQQMATDRVVLSAWKQGVEGLDEPVYYEGKVVGHITRYIPQMTKMLAQAWRPEEFTDRAETTHRGGVMISPRDLSKYTDEELAQMEAIERRAEERAAESRQASAALPKGAAE